jgi:hypothetical protein
MTKQPAPEESADNEPNGIKYIPAIFGVFALTCIFVIYLTFRILNPIFEKMANSALP